MNIIRDPWLQVEYFDGSFQKVSVRQAFIDAQKIKKLVTPVFQQKQAYIYDVAIIQFLTVILLAAYFKPENNFQARDDEFAEDLLNDSWDIDLILAYLDKYQHKFNLSDDQYPFFQDIRLKGTETSENYNKASILIPSDNAFVFKNGKEKFDLKNYKISEEELAYTLIYTRILSSPICSSIYGRSLSWNTELWVIPTRLNLFETLICNALPLKQSETGSNYDRPSWEFDSVEDIIAFKQNVPVEQNVLFATTFPGNPVYCNIQNGYLTAYAVAEKDKTTEQCLFDSAEVQQLAVGYLKTNPWSVATYGINSQTKENVWKPKGCPLELQIMFLCMIVTEHLPDGFCCPVLDNDLQMIHGSECYIYYRVFGDSNKMTVVRFGRLESIDQEALSVIQKPEYREILTHFVDTYKAIRGTFSTFYSSEGLKRHVVSYTDYDNLDKTFAAAAETIFFSKFLPNLDQPDISKTNIAELIALARDLFWNIHDQVPDVCKFMKSYHQFVARLNNIKKKEGIE